MKRPDTFTEVEDVAGKTAIPQLSVSDALRGLKNEVRLFTPALLVTHGGFDRDPVQEFDARFDGKPDERPFVIDLQRDHEFFFRGLGFTAVSEGRRPVNWDKRLYAVPHTIADQCFDFLNGIAFSNPKIGYYANVLSYDLQIQDPTAQTVVRLDVKIFGVMANSFVAYMSNDFVRPRAIKVPIQTGFNALNCLPTTNLFVSPTDEDPLDMRDQ